MGVIMTVTQTFPEPSLNRPEDQNPDPDYIYVFVRLDLPSPEQVAVQAAHAAFELGRTVTLRRPEPPHMVMIGVRDARRLRKLIREDLSGLGPTARFSVFREPDLKNQVTAVAVGPVYGEARQVFSRWKTLRLGPDLTPPEHGLR